MAYLYVRNLNSSELYTQLRFRLDNGSEGIITQGKWYELSTTEAGRASQFVFLQIGTAPVLSSVVSATELPVRGVPNNGDVPIWDSSTGVFKPGAVSGGGGGSAADASTTVKGISLLSTSPAVSTSPVVVGTNDSRVTADQAAGTPSIRTLGSGSQQAMAGATRLDQITAPTTSVALNGQKLTGVGTPTTAQDAVTKAYVDSIVEGISWKDSVRAATTANITLSGTQTVDGVALAAGNRVLVKAQTAGQDNGIYVVAAGAWSRATDADSSIDIDGAGALVTEGTTQANQLWVLQTDTPTLGTTPLVFVQIGAGGSGIPNDASVTDAKVAAGAAIQESKLSLASDAAVGTASRRTLGTGATQAAAGNHTHAASAITFTPTGTIAASTVQTAIAEVAAEAGSAWVSASTYGFADGASAATIKTALVNAIAALPSGRGTILLPDADVTIDLSAGGVNIGTNIVRLVGGGRTRIKCSNEGSTGSLVMFPMNSTGGELTVEGVRLEGPDVLGSGGTCELISVGSAAASGRITAYNSEFIKFSYALRVSSSTNWIGWITAVNCKFTGYNSSTQFSTGILPNTQGTGALGRGVRVVDCEFRSFGLGSSNLFHAAYIATDWDVEFRGNHFYTSIGTGYCIQLYDSNTTSIAASPHQKIIGNHFYPALTVKGVAAANKSRPLIQGNTFENTTSAIIFSNGGGTTGGGADIIGNQFTGSLPSTNVIDLSGATAGDQGVVIRGNRFSGSASRIINFQNGYWLISENVFELSAASTTTIDAVGAFTRLTVEHNTFRGSSTQWIHVEAAGSIDVEGNFFWQTAGTSYRNSSTSTVQRIVSNDFSQVAGASVLNSSTPTTYEARGNYGSVGLTDTSVGIAVQDEGSAVTSRAILNFVGNGVTAADDSANSRTRITVNGLTNIDLRSYGLPTDGSTDCRTAILAAMSANASGRLMFPPGVYKWTTTNALDLTTGHYDVEGAGKDLTQLWCSADADNAFITMWRFYGEIRNIWIQGPTAVGVGNVGSAPLRRGVILRDQCRMMDSLVANFGHGVVIDGNHIALTNTKVMNCKYNLSWAQGMAGYTTSQAASFTHGNQTLVNVDLTGGGDSSIYIAGDSKIDSSTFIQVHTGFCPYGITAATKGTQEQAIGNSSFYDCSFESPGQGYINDLGYNSANRRLWKAIQWHNPLTGGFDSTYAVGGVASNEMCRLGLMFNWTIYSRNGDSSNTGFGHVGTAAGGVGFRAEQFSGIQFHNADQLWSAASAASKSMFALGGSAIGVQDVWFTILGRYLCGVAKSNATLVDDRFVMQGGDGDPNYQFHTGLVHANGSSAACLGRVTAAGPTTAGNLVSFVTRGSWSNSYTTDTGILPGHQLTIDSTNAGGVKRAASVTDQIIGHALRATASGRVETMVDTRYNPGDM